MYLRECIYIHFSVTVLHPRQQCFLRDFKPRPIVAPGFDTIHDSLHHIFIKKSMIRFYDLNVYVLTKEVIWECLRKWSP